MLVCMLHTFVCCISVSHVGEINIILKAAKCLRIDVNAF